MGVTNSPAAPKLLACCLPLILNVLGATNAAAMPPQPDAQAPPAAPTASDDVPPSDDAVAAAAAAAKAKRRDEQQRAERKAQLKQEIIAELEQARQRREAQRAAKAAHARRHRDMQRARLAASTRRHQPPPPKHAVDPHTLRYKPGTGLVVRSSDGAFAMATRLRAQLRQQVTFGPEPATQVFQLRRARLQFKGHAFNKHNKYKIELAFSPRDLGVKKGVLHHTPLLTWYLEFDYLRDFTIRTGQYKVPYSRQRVTSSGDLQLVDRSIANGEFNHDRDIGFDIRSKDVAGLGGRLRYYAGVYMGEGRDFGDKNATADFKLHYLARVEVLPMGKFKDYQEADLARQTSPKLSLAGAYSFHHQAQELRGVTGSAPDDGGTTDYHSFTADYAFKYAGFSSFGEFHYRQGRRYSGADVPPIQAARNGVGWSLQAGYLLAAVPLEMAARYSGIAGIGKSDPGTLVDAAGFTSLAGKHSAGVGLSYYFGGHPWKLQADYFRSWQGSAFDAGSNQIRTQLQLAL